MHLKTSLGKIRRQAALFRGIRERRGVECVRRAG
jgi:hypothetical protein